METERLCLDCSKSLKGRVDKKFCDDYCRNSYNNKLQSSNNTYVRQINRALKKNRRILEELLGKEGMMKHPKATFLEKGFKFRYHTHQYTNRKGDIYYFCYEFGFLTLEGDWLLIVKRKDIVPL